MEVGHTAATGPVCEPSVVTSCKRIHRVVGVVSEHVFSFAGKARQLLFPAGEVVGTVKGLLEGARCRGAPRKIRTICRPKGSGGNGASSRKLEPLSCVA